MQNIDLIPPNLLRTLFLLFVDLPFSERQIINPQSYNAKKLFSQPDFEAFCDAVILQPISGLSGTNWYAKYSGSSVLAREMNSARAALGIDREQEASILHQLSSLEIAPKVIYQTNEWLILEWIEEIHRPQLTPKDFAKLAITLHQQPLSGFKLAIKSRFELLFQNIDQARLTPKWQTIHNAFLQQDLPKHSLTVLAHMDLHPGNLIFANNTWRLIDWEYAADTDLFLEFAALFSGMNWQDKEKAQFLTTYHDYCLEKNLHELSNLTWDLNSALNAITAWQPWLNYLSFLWFEVRWQQTKNPQFIQLNRHSDFR